MSLLKSLRKKKKHLFFGWWIVLGSYVIQVLNGALLFHAFSAYILPLQTEFGWSRASVSGVFSMVRAESGILGPLQGWLIERYGCKAMMQIGIVLFGIGYLCFSRIDSLWDFYLSSRSSRSVRASAALSRSRPPSPTCSPASGLRPWAYR